MATESFAVNIYDVVTCFICKEHTGQLIQLNCFHICHKSCLERTLGNPRPGSKFNCSECNTTNLVPTDVQGYPDELLQYKLKDITSIFSNSPPPCNICEQLGEENVSTNYCITCKKHLCSDDTKRHAFTVPDHTVITNAQIQSEQYLPRILAKKAKCRAHSTDDSAKVLEFYCEECQIPVCQAGCVTNHKLHTTIASKEASHKFKEELKNKATKIPNKMDQCEFVIDQLEQLLDEIEINSKQEIENCQKWGEDFKKNVDKVVDKNVQNIEKKAQTQRNEIMNIKEKQDYQNKQLQIAKDYMEIFIKFGSESDILQKYKIFCENLQHCLQQSTKVQMTTKSYTVKWLKDYERYLEKFLKLETVSKNHHIEKPPPPSPPQLKGCHLENKWETDWDWRTGIAVDDEDIIAVKEKGIEFYGMDGQDKGEIEYHGSEFAWDIEVLNKKLIVSDIRAREIIATDRNGKIERKVSLPVPTQKHTLDKPYALCLAVDHTQGDIYISSSKENTVYKCAMEQGQVNPFIITDLNGPCSLCVTYTHEVIVSNHYSHNVCKFNKQSHLVWKYGKEGTGEREFKGPRGVCVNSWDQVFVCDMNNSRIHYLSSDGKCLSFIEIGEEIERPWAITYNKGTDRLVVTSGSSPGQIYVIRCDYDCRKRVLILYKRVP